MSSAANTAAHGDLAPDQVTPRWKPDKSPGGIGQAKSSDQKRFRVKASPARWREIRARKLGPCLVCMWLGQEQEKPSTLHHVVSKSLGGSDCESNCVPLCGTGTTGHHGLIERHDKQTCATFAAAVQLYDDAAYAYAVGKLGEDGWLRRYYVNFVEPRCCCGAPWPCHAPDCMQLPVEAPAPGTGANQKDVGR